MSDLLYQKGLSKGYMKKLIIFVSVVEYFNKRRYKIYLVVY